MRYFKIVLACFGFILAVVGITAGVLFLTGKFDKEVIQPGDIAFEITEKLTENDFEVVVNTTTENVTEKDVTLSLTNQTEADGMISDGIITIPKVVKLGKPFTVKVNKTHYAGMTEEWNVGGTSIIRAKSTNPLIQEATPLTVEVDVPVHSLGVELVTTTGTKIGTVSARNLKNYMKTLAEGEEDKKVVELAVGSVVRLQPVFTPAKSAKTTNGEPRKVLFEIFDKGEHIDFVQGENDLIEVLRQTTVENIKINAYCFRTSADQYAAQNKGVADEELITIMSANGICGESSQIFVTNQKITSFTSTTNDEYLNLAINSPMTLVANGKVDNAFDLGLGLASDAGVAKLEDKIAVIKLFAYWQNSDGAWEDAGDKLEIVGQTSSKKENGVKAKINKNDANLSSWKVIASETGKYKIVAQLSYEYYSSSSSVPTEINFEIPFNNILVSDPISSDVAWKSTLPAIKTLVVLDGETAAEKYYPTINLADFVDIKNPNATYKVVRFFAYSTEGKNLANVINCSLYSGNFAVPDSSNQYEVFEIPNGILTAKDVGNFRIFFATVVSDYMGNPKIQFGGYLFESFSNTNTINVVKSLKQLDASMTVNQQEDGKDYNKNTDETTRDYIFHVRQQDEKVFTLSLFVSDIEIFERDYAEGKISIDFLLDGQKSKILELTGDYVIDVESKRIDFQVSVKSLPTNEQPTLECKVTYDLDHRLDKFVSNNGNKVQIKVLNGFAQEIVFDAVKDANPRNSAENPIQVEIKFNAGSDNVATNVEYGITLNEQKLILEDLSKVTINEEALNKTYTLSSNKPAVIAVEDDPEKGPKLSILGATEDEDVIITATAADGSGLTANLYFRVLASLQITLTPNKSEITMDGYQGSQTNFRTYFDAKAGDIDLNNLLEFNVPIENNDKFVFADDTLKVVSTLGRDASLQLYITSNFGFTKVIPIRIVSNITASNTYANNDNGLDDSDFVARGETPPTERGTRVYAENSREITFVLTQEKPTQTNISISVDDFELPKNGGIQNISYNNGILTVCFDAVSQMTEKTIIFKKNFSENDEYAFVYTMKFLVFPNIKASLVSNVGTEENPASYVCGETVVYDAKDNSNGLIKLERIMGSNIISEHATLEARINGEWVALSSNSGVFTLPTSFRAIEGSFVEIRITYDGCVLTPIKLFFKPFFDESILLDAKVLYNGKHYVPFVATENNSIALSQAEGVVYTIINATSEQYLRIRANQIEKLDRLYTKIIASEKLRIENGNGVTELPILILPIKYPFVVYDSIENAESEETYRNVDLKQVVESESFYDTLEAGSEEIIDLKSKILVDGLESGGALVSVINADGSANNYVNYDAQNLTISANSVGKDQIVYVKVKCGAEFEEAFEFVYRIKVTANQQIKVFYPYIEYNEEYNVQNAYEYLYFGSKNQVSVDLMEEFDAQKTPNKKLLEELFPTTNGQTYARRFVVVREKDGKLIPIEYKDLHFEIASVGIGKTVIPADQVSNYVTITEKTTTNGVLQSANMFVNRGQSVETIDIRIRAFTSSGAEAYYRFQVNDKPISYTTYYKNQKIDYDGFSVASDGASEINLNENVDVRVGENPQQPVSPNEYKFYLIVHEKLGTDYSQFITLSGGIIQISTLVNDVETTVVIYNNKGEISRFNLVLKCTIDHEIISTTVNNEGIFDIGESVDFFNATSADGNYSMQEITTRVYVRNYLNGTDIGSTSANNLFVNVGGYSIKDISKRYNQYVLIDNLKVYAENLMDTWKGKFYLGDDAKYDVLTEGEKSYIRYNGSVIEVGKNKNGEPIVNIPLQSITDGDTVAYKVETEDITGAQYVIIPHLKFSNGNDTRDYVLYDRVFHEEETDPATKYTNEPFDINRKGNYTTYVNAYVNGYIRYKVDKVENSDGTTELKAAILRLTHNNVQYVAQVDKEHFDHEYITIDNEKHYFTRFYTISYDGIAANAKDTEGNDVLNVPKVRYMLGKDETTIDLSKIIFYTQEEISNNVLKLGGTNYISNMFKFYVDDGSEESSEIKFSKDDAGNNTWTISRESNNKFSPINIMIKDTTGKYVVGRLTILPTVETSTSEKESNKTIFIEAGDTTKVDYAINSGTIEVGSYAKAMTPVNKDKPFTGKIETDHPDWKNYVYGVSSDKYTNLSIDNNGQISDLSRQEPWGKITVEAKLRYSRSDKSLTTTLPFETWKEAFFGKNVFNNYNALKTELDNQSVTINLSENINNGNVVNGVKFDKNGNITNVAYDSTVTLVFKQKCKKCNAEIPLGKTHDCWYVVGTEEIINISNITDEQILQSLESDRSFEKIEEGQKYVYTLNGTLQKSEDGVWTLDGKIIKTTQQKHSFTAKFEYKEQGDLQVELLEETKDPDAGEEQPTTYGKTVSETELQPVYTKLGFASFEEFKNAIISLSTTSGTVAVVENGIAIAGATEQTVTLSYTLNLPKALKSTHSFTIDPLEINDDGYAKLAQALFGNATTTITTILGYANWAALLADCNVDYFAGYSEETQKDGSTKYYFGGHKEINITLTTQNPKHTGTFYIVNQEHGNKTIHGIGNLQKINESDESLKNKHIAAENEIKSVVDVGGGYWVLPMATTKTLKSDAVLEKLEEGKGTFFDLVENWWGVTEQDITNSKDFASTPFELETAASLASKEDPFNTITIYQHGYAIGNVHIYLEDYCGDATAGAWKISTSSKVATESESGNAWSRVIETNNGSKIKFVIDNDGHLTTTLETKEFSEQIKNINIFTDDQIKALSEQKTVEIADKNDESITYSYKLSSGAKLTQDETTKEWTLTGEITKTTTTVDAQTIYLTQNAVMNAVMKNNKKNNQYLFSNGLLLEWDGTNISLSMINKESKNKESKIEFAFKGVTFEIVKVNDNTFTDPAVYQKQMGEQIPTIHYFEGLKDIVEQPTNSKIEEGSKTYKAEKTGDVVGYKDKIEKDMFNFDKWEYSASYVNENGTTIQAIGKSIKIVGLSKTNTQLKITVSGISEEGGDYTFVVDLNQNPAVTIIGGNESITSPDTPFDGGVLTGGQEKIVNLGEIFEINAKESPVEIKNYEGNTDDESLLQVLYDNLYLYYLVGKLNGYSSNVFKITKDENSGQNIISIIFTGAEEQEFTIVKDADGKFSLVDKEGNPVEGNFVLELNTDLYEFSAVNEPKENGSTGENGTLPEGGTTPTNEGDSGSGGSSAEGGEQPQPTTINVLTITIKPVFTYQYQVESNIKLIAIKDTNNFAQTGQLTITGGEIKTESVVKLRFSVLRGKGADAKEVAFAYYSLSLKPSVGAVVSYPTISTSTKDENGNFVAVGQTTEYFYADAGEFDINAKSTISSGEASRMVITKYAYGTATDSNGKTTSCIVTYKVEGTNLTIIKIGEESVKSTENQPLENNVLTATVTTEKETKYTISVYVPNLTISYTASSSQNIIKGKDKENNDILTNSWESEGKFTFDMTGVTVSEAEVVISAQATIGSYTYTFAQYTFTVCKNPVISTLVTTDPTHLDGNGAEILPINGGDPLTPFNTARGYVEIDGTRYEVTKNNETEIYEVVVGSESYPVKNGQITIGDGENAKIYKVVYYNIINNSPRLQFVYNNLILSSSYNNKLNAQTSRHIMLKEIKNSEGVVQKYTFLLDGVEYTINSGKTEVSWETSTAIEDNKFKIGKVEYTINYKEDGTFDKIVYQQGEQTQTITKSKFNVDGVEYTLVAGSDGKFAKINWTATGKIDTESYKFTIDKDEWTIKGTMITSSKQSPITDLNISSKTIETGTVKFKFDVQDVSGSYSYKTVWDYRMNTTLDSHTIMGNYDPENTSELLNYYYLNAGKAYNIIETFGLTKYFSTESLTEIFNLGFDDSATAAAGYEGVKFTADGKSINILGAPEGGMNFRIKFKPYRDAEFKTIGITILPSIEIVVNYRTETIYENDPYAYGLITYNQANTYRLVDNARGTDFTIQRNGVTADVVKGEYTLEIVDGTDETLQAKITQEDKSATLTIANPPKLNAKRVVIKISDKYGYYQYLRYVVGAETQVVISSNDITFTTGGNIEWDKNNQFPISFKKSGEETIQLASFYTAQITDATSENTSDNYGSDSSLKIDTDGNLYGVQLDSVITKKNLVKNNGNDYSNWTYVQKQSDNFFTGTKYEVDETNDNKTYKYSYLITRNEIGKLTEITRTITQGQTKIAEDSIKKATDGVWKFVDKDTTGKEKVDENGNKIYDTRFVLTEIRNDVYYIPYNGKTPISYDVYKLIAKSGDNDKVLKSFSNYKKQVVEGDGETLEECIDSTTGAFTPKKKDTTSYYDIYVIELYARETSTNPDATMTFKVLEVGFTDNLYYASRANPSDCYTFEYEIKINGEGESIVAGKTIKDIGNAQYGSASSLNTTLKITVNSKVGEKTEILDNIDIGILLKFGIYPEVKQNFNGQINYDYVGRGDKLTEVIKGAEIKLTGDSAPAGLTPKYYTVLGDTSETSKLTSKTADKMTGGTLAPGSYSYDGNTRVLSLKATLTGNTATINNIKYVYDSTTLTIGYRVVSLTDGQFVDDVTGITYKVDGTQLLISKKIDNANTVTINNIKYTVETSGATPTVKYETLYESIFVVWEYDHDNNSETSPLIYWAQWNYKVVDKFNQVTTGDPLEAQDGNIKVKLDWKSGNYRFNPNTLKLYANNSELGTAKWISELNNNRYEIKINGTTYKIVLVENNGSTTMKFIDSSNNYYNPDNSNGLELKEETTENSSWADKITLTGLDGKYTLLKDANDIRITVNGENQTDNTITDDDDVLLGKTMHVEIGYTNGIGEGTDPVLVKLLFNGNDIKVTFEHFDPTKSN